MRLRSGLRAFRKIDINESITGDKKTDLNLIKFACYYRLAFSTFWLLFSIAGCIANLTNVIKGKEITYIVNGARRATGLETNPTDLIIPLFIWITLIIIGFAIFIPTIKTLIEIKQQTNEK